MPDESSRNSKRPGPDRALCATSQPMTSRGSTSRISTTSSRSTSTTGPSKSPARAERSECSTRATSTVGLPSRLAMKRPSRIRLESAPWRAVSSTRVLPLNATQPKKAWAQSRALWAIRTPHAGPPCRSLTARHHAQISRQPMGAVVLATGLGGSRMSSTHPEYPSGVGSISKNKSGSLDTLAHGSLAGPP
jgi:hypothetical protein